MEIKNFYLKKEVYDLDDISQNADSYIGGYNNENLVENIEKNRKKYVASGLLMVEGSIVFISNYKEIGNIPIFDDLPSLYCYYLNAIEEYLDNGEATFYYPSQPIEVIIKKDIGQQTKITIDENSLKVNEKFFLDSLLNNSQHFFGTLLTELKLNKYKHELKQIESIKKRLTD
ncbi:MAG: hypothetical protein ACQEWU_21515 [Bacillota bacterium]|uniref:Uncharacterized protein n=1 Tax=Virgibacillus salarius TaxID=447199 RepID=A0A941E0B1_9BACI|nr:MULTISPECIES: hypothetical protein [Virgibacillus]MBR7798344.1 hypothetical protein [Virgibacillus salarius]MCC2252777.1 hypothetical protein [Virgibacillus sp. AGTR]NAZ11053.1 hypothetical protein [Agaribacter marinus]WBX80633.1 hypothetical protein PD280_01890 [Virgibacillus salarius]